MKDEVAAEVDEEMLAPGLHAEDAASGELAFASAKPPGELDLQERLADERGQLAGPAQDGMAFGHRAGASIGLSPRRRAGFRRPSVPWGRVNGDGLMGVGEIR